MASDRHQAEDTDRFLAELAVQRRAPSTLHLYRWALARFAAWAEQTGEPWTPELVADYVAWCQTRGKRYDLRTNREKGEAASADTVRRIVLRYLAWRDGAAGGRTSVRPAREDGLEEFGTWLLHRGKSEKTALLYRGAVRDFRDWFERAQGRAFEPAHWTGRDILAYRAHRMRGATEAPERRPGQAYDGPRKPGGLNAYLVGLRSYVAFLRKQRILTFDPFDDLEEVTLPRPPARPRWLRREEQEALRRALTAAAKGQGRQVALRDRALLLAMLDAGLREAQVVKLRPGDVTVEPRRDARIEVWYGKHRRSYDIPIESDELHEALVLYDQSQPADRAYFFASQRGEQLSTRAVRLQVGRWGMRTGLKGVTPHRLRHSFGRKLHLAGVPLDQIARLLGQLRKDGTPNLASVAIYTAASDDDLRAALRAAEGV